MVGVSPVLGLFFAGALGLSFWILPVAFAVLSPLKSRGFSSFACMSRLFEGRRFGTSFSLLLRKLLY